MLVNFKSDKFNYAPGIVLEFYGNGARSRPVIEKKKYEYIIRTIKCSY